MRPQRLPQVDPAAVGLNPARLSEIEPLVRESLARGQMPGCVVALGRHGQLAYLRPFGWRQTRPAPIAMTVDTVFDLASLTKPVATATSVMQLVAAGQVDLQAPVARYLPEFTGHGKEAITVQQLLTHESGLTPDNELADYEQGPARAWERICALQLRDPPGTRFRYSDVGFIVLGELVRRVAGESLDQFAQRTIFEPLGMAETTFRPVAELQARAAPTQQRDGHWMQGEVHDPRAFLLGGVAGHAGLFSTADDLALYAEALLAATRGQTAPLLAPAAVQLMTADYPVSSGVRGLGWDKRTGFSINRGDGFSSRAFGHGGFTGTVLWIDPQLDLFVIFLSNRVHPAGEGAINPLAGKIGSIAAAAVADPARAGTATSGTARSQQEPVLCGIDVLERDGFELLRGRRVGLITNHTGVNRAGVRTAQLLQAAPHVELVALLSPEHGIAGQLDEAAIADGRDEETGVPIWSLYGASRRPTPERLAGIDTLVFDIQDIGTRFYTYISTMAYALEAAAAAGLSFVVLDRPNPINGLDVDGPVLDAGRECFVGCHPLPVRHGMTVGELATLFRDERSLQSLNLTVVRLEGWRRADFFDATGLVWINPSPNMRSPAEALLYPGVGLLETTNVSVGRGTDTPFEVIGAPWLDGTRLARELHAADLPGVRFIPIHFTPQSSKFAGEACSGIRLIITSWAQFDPLRTGLELAVTLRRLYPEQWDVESYDRLLLNASVCQAVRDGRSTAEIMEGYRSKLEEFRQRRRNWLLYD
jgi:uncharacterized protein YbbC (DUF1343 family)